MNESARLEILNYMIQEIEKKDSLTIQFPVAEKHIFEGDCTYEEYRDELEFMTEEGLLAYCNGGHELTAYGHRTIRPIDPELALQIREEWLETFVSKPIDSWLSIPRTDRTLDDPRYQRVDLLNELIFMVDDGLLLQDGSNYQLTHRGRQHYQQLSSKND